MQTINWRAKYATNIGTAAGRLRLKPGQNKVSDEEFDALRRVKHVENLIKAGRLVMDVPPQLRSDPSARLAPEPTVDDEDESGMPAWTKRSKLEVLQNAAESRGIVIEHKTREELIEELQAWDDENADDEDEGDVEDDDEDGTAG